MQATRVRTFLPLRAGAWSRIGVLGVLAVLTLTLAGDGLRAATSPGIDPFEILKLQVRPNVIIVLDSSGSMRQRVTATGTDYNNPGPNASNAAVVGDDHDSKMWNAKDVIRRIVTNNQTKVSFMFGRYTTSSSAYGPDTNTTFLYKVTCASTDTACQNAAAAISIPYGGANVKRSTTSDIYTESDGRRTYYLESKTFYNGVVVRARTDNGNCSGACTTTTGAPAKADPAPVTVQMLTSAGANTGTAVTFYFQGVRWNVGNNSTSCNGFQPLIALQSCTNNDQIGLFNPFLEDESVRDAATGDIVGYNPASDPITKLATLAGGIRASGSTPIANSLDDIKTTFDGTIWPNRPNSNQRTFVIFITDGDDTCGGYQAAAYQAQRLYNASAADVTKKVETFLIVFGGGVTVNQANQIAYGGSGMTAVPASSGEWTRDATAAEVAACTTCRPAFTAATASDLEAAIQAALDQSVNSGEFSDQQSITESVYEFGPYVNPPVDPLDRDHRYDATIPVLLQSTFELPTYTGHLKAFRNASGVASMLWDAGSKLCERVTGYKAKTSVTPAVCDIGGVAATGPDTPATAMSNGSYSFATLTGASTPDLIAASSARIKRRIFTTTQNGVNPSYTPPNLVTSIASATWSNQVPLWPPNDAVDPARQGNSYAAGALDAALGVTSLTTAQLNALGACLVTSDAGGGAVSSECARTGFNLKEAREIILAFTAGAQVVYGSDNKPKRDANGDILFKARTWILAESTLAAPGIVSVPLQNKPSQHDDEWGLYRDGLRAGVNETAVDGIALGFGLRNPDDDGTTASKNDPALKPVMSVVYHGTNHMLHAFRAGPCPTSVASCGGETGGEELWAFVPYDQLAKLYLRMRGQSRSNPIYVIAAPVRFADVFVIGAVNRTFGGAVIAGDGVWRTVLTVARGAGGKSLTAIDITAPGSFAVRSNKTNPPIVMWNRGNPDTNDGLAKTASNTYNNTTAAGSSDYTAYLKMGETWSVPAIGYVTAANNVTTRSPGGVEYVAWMGSGYSDLSTEGTTFYALDVVTGDVIGSHTVTARSAALPTANSLVARTSGYAKLPLSFYNLSSGAANTSFNAAQEKVTEVYFPDLHGRIYRFVTDTPATAPTVLRDTSADGNQPFSAAVALIAFDSDSSGVKAHVFAESGFDSRVPLPTASPFFRMYAVRDDSGTGTDVFPPIDFPQGFRGNVQPATVFNPDGRPRVFYGGIRFNPTGADCVSSFDSVVYALQGATGAAAYDLSAGGDDRYVTITNQRINAIQTSGGQLITDFGLGAQNPPPPPAPPNVSPSSVSQKSNVYIPLPGQGVPGTVPFKRGTSVCR